MVFQTLCLIISSIIIAKFLEEKRYSVATVAHVILFIVLSLAYLFSTNFEPIQEMCIRWVGENPYYFLHDALVENFGSYIVLGNISVLLIVEIVTFVFIPLLSIAVIIEEARKIFKKYRDNNKAVFSIVASFIKRINPCKDCSYTFNKTYLKFGRFLN